MFAVFRTGGKQHRVTENDRIVVERLSAQPGAVVSFDNVLLMAGNGGAPLLGNAVPGEARVFGQVLEQKRGKKIIVFKKKRRQGYRRKRGHRQYQTVLRIVGISATGEEPVIEPLTEGVTVPELVGAGMEVVADQTAAATNDDSDIASGEQGAASSSDADSTAGNETEPTEAEQNASSESDDESARDHNGPDIDNVPDEAASAYDTHKKE